MTPDRYRSERRAQLNNCRIGRAWKAKGLFHTMAQDALAALRALFYGQPKQRLVVVMVREEIRHG